ncbi:TlpA disulfide reductase family protein [Massilia sp. S19_KUP03_FR1]|uniref:TlpA disulfide reductase family protein n=1 Tax=Massilia sp. S19_KUP03_FR1 TaxID=3025503 RepID=UPI002FCDC3E9
MDAVKLGPLVIPIQVALVLTSILLAHAVGAWFRASRSVDPGPILWKMIFGGFGAARLVFVLRHADLYASTPLAVLDMRDGGFDSVAGFVTACVIGAELSRRTPLLRKPVFAAALLGCTLFIGATALNQALFSARAPVPAVDLRRLDGSAVTLTDFTGRPMVVNLWASWCPPCRREMPAMQMTQRAHPEMAFVFVNQGESAEIVQQYLAAQGLQTQNVLIDRAKQLSARTASSGYPTTLFYDAKGQLVQRHMGELSRATLEDKIEGLQKLP